MAPGGSDDDKGDKTQFGVAPPPQVKRTPPSDSTNRAIAPPPKPPSAQPPAAAQPPASPDADEEGTVILTRRREVTATLQRLQPPGHSEVIHLDRTSYLVGRSHKCDLPLYSESASREHARLTFRDAAWYVQPLGGKPVIADGVTVHDEQRLTHKMRLQLGGDELLFLDESAAASPPEARPVAPASTRPAWGVLLGVAVVVALGLAAWWWFSSGARLP
jgi:pSer/pThr/pTyr-binding forkhead associated (FHA) protein